MAFRSGEGMSHFKRKELGRKEVVEAPTELRSDEVRFVRVDLCELPLHRETVATGRCFGAEFVAAGINLGHQLPHHFVQNGR